MHDYDLIRRRRKALVLYCACEDEDSAVLLTRFRATVWARDLLELLAEHPEYTDELDEYFEHWDGKLATLLERADITLAAGIAKEMRTQRILPT